MGWSLLVGTPILICYASRTGTRRNLAALRRHGWRLLISRGGCWRDEGFPNFALDNGAWSDFRAGRPFDGEAFDRLLDRFGSCADWIALPDIVAGGLASLDLSFRWLNRCLSLSSLVLLPVQDGMTEEDVAPLVGRKIGIFLGGSTEWKLATMKQWGAFCWEHDLYYHVARVNTRPRFALAAAAGATSVDGSNASRYSINLPKIDLASRQWDLFAGTGI